MDKIAHKSIPVNGLSMHVAELGEGPTVLFVHGFPELWYTWRHQITFLAARGYRAVAPDMRGYGDSTGAPLEDPSKFSMLHLVGDLISLIDAICPNEEEKVFVVGHDWGAFVAWHLCMYRPDRVRGLVNMSIAFLPRDPEKNPVERFREFYGEDHYICRFQEPGDIEAEFGEVGIKQVLRYIYAFRTPAPYYYPKGDDKRCNFSATRPPWLPEDEFNFYVDKFEQTGLTGALNYYRALGLSWELNAPWAGAQVKVPTKFIVGEFDMTYDTKAIKDYIHQGGFKKDVPLLQEVVVVEGAAHFVNQERPDEINEHIYSFVKQFSTSS